MEKNKKVISERAIELFFLALCQDNDMNGCSMEDAMTIALNFKGEIKELAEGYVEAIR